MVQNVATRRWTVEELYRIHDAGVLGPEERIELIEGEVIPIMTQGPRHSICISFANNLLVKTYGSTHIVRVQLPLELSPHSEPEPDFALVKADDILQARRHRIPADLVIEVAETSLKYDRQEKGSLYARMEIKEYWILNVVDRVLERHLQPAGSNEAPYGAHYAQSQVFGEDETIKAEFLVGPELRVGDLLGPSVLDEE